MVYILLADGFEEIEALAPCDMLCHRDRRVVPGGDDNAFQQSLDGLLFSHFQENL